MKNRKNLLFTLAIFTIFSRLYAMEKEVNSDLVSNNVDPLVFSDSALEGMPNQKEKFKIDDAALQDGEQDNILPISSSNHIKLVEKGLVDEFNVMVTSLPRYINLKDKKGRTPLIAASYNGQLKMVEYLIYHKAKLNELDEQGETALTNSLKFRYFNVAQCLVEKGADVNAGADGKMPLDFALARGNARWVNYLLENKADLTKAKVAYDSVLLGSPLLLQVLFNYKLDPNTLIDEDSNTYLIHKAARLSKPEVVDVIVKAKADLNKISEEGTPLVIALVNRKPLTASVLIKGNADVTTAFKDKYPVHYALEIEDDARNDLVEEFIKTGINVNVQDGFGNTLLHSLIAEENQKNIDLTLFLLKNGASIEGVLNNNKKSVLDIAMNNHKHSYVAIFAYLYPHLIERKHKFSVDWASLKGTREMQDAMSINLIVTNPLTVTETFIKKLVDNHKLNEWISATHEENAHTYTVNLFERQQTAIASAIDGARNRLNIQQQPGDMIEMLPSISYDSFLDKK